MGDVLVTIGKIRLSFDYSSNAWINEDNSEDVYPVLKGEDRAEALVRIMEELRSHDSGADD